jgi:outer membrane protein TolC
VRRQALLRDLEAFEQGRLARLRTRVRVGLETPREGQTAEADLLAIQARATEPDPTLAQSLQRIAALMGRATIDPTWIPSATALSVPVVRLESTPADLLRERPDVRHAEFVVLRAAAELGTAQAELYPHISLVGAITAATRVSGGVGLSSNSVLSAGPAISIPLFDWGMRRAARDARAEELSAAALAYRQTVFDAVADVEITLASLNHSVSLIDLLQHAVASRDEAARRSSALRRAGLTENIEIASTARSAIEARLELEEAQYAGMIAVVQLHKALGGALMPGES